MPERGPDPLARHLDQAELRHGERLGAGPVAAQVGAQLLEHLVAVGARLHIDEVADDDPADVPQPDLPRDLAGCLEVGPQDRLLGVLLPGVASRVDVDAHQRLGGLDDQRAAGGELDSRLEQLADLRLDVELVEQRQTDREVLDDLVGEAHVQVAADPPKVGDAGIHRQGPPQVGLGTIQSEVLGRGTHQGLQVRGWRASGITLVRVGQPAADEQIRPIALAQEPASAS